MGCSAGEQPTKGPPPQQIPLFAEWANKRCLGQTKAQSVLLAQHYSLCPCIHGCLISVSVRPCTVSILARSSADFPPVFSCSLSDQPPQLSLSWDHIEICVNSYWIFQEVRQPPQAGSFSPRQRTLLFWAPTYLCTPQPPSGHHPDQEMAEVAAYDPEQPREFCNAGKSNQTCSLCNPEQPKAIYLLHWLGINQKQNLPNPFSTLTTVGGKKHDTLVSCLSNLTTTLKGLLWHYWGNNSYCILIALHHKMCFEINRTEDTSSFISWVAHKASIRGFLIQLSSWLKKAHNSYSS